MDRQEIIDLLEKARAEMLQGGNWSINYKEGFSDAIDQALTLLKQPKCKTCEDKKVVQIECEACAKDIPHPASECGGEKPCPDCQQPKAEKG